MQTRSVLTITMILLFGCYHVISNPTEAIGSEAELKTRAIGSLDNMFPVEPNTLISIDPPAIPINRSFYFPIPENAKVLDASISISNSINNENIYPNNTWLNIGDGRKEYEFKPMNDVELGQWGRLNRTVEGFDLVEAETSIINPNTIEFVLPKNCTVQDFGLTLKGHQRKDEWMEYSMEGDQESSSFGTVVKVINNDILACSDPNVNNQTGQVNFILYPEMQLIGRIPGLSEWSEFGYSMSDSLQIKKSSFCIGVGAPRYNKSQGMVIVLPVSIGPEPGLKPNPSLPIIYGNGSDEEFGSCVVLSNIDSDSEIEVLVGAPKWNNSQGRVYIYSLNPEEMALTLESVINGTGSKRFGTSISVGNYNNDLYTDIIVSSETEVDIFFQQRKINTISNGTLNLSSFNSDIQIKQVRFIGYQLSKGYETLAVCAPDTSEGRVYLYTGNDEVIDKSDLTIKPPIGKNRFGFDISPGSDLNQDGIPEVAISTPGSSISNGWVGIYSKSNFNSPLTEISGSQQGSFFGTSIDFGSDLLNDGYNDLLTGSPGFVNETGSETGLLSLHDYFRVEDLPSNTPSVMLNGNTIWEYTGTHFSSNDEIEIQGNANQLNEIINNSPVNFSNDYDDFVRFEIQISSIADNPIGGSTWFSVGDFDFTYLHCKKNINITQDINNYLARTDLPSIPGIDFVPVPFVFFADSICSLRVDDISIKIDMAPVINPNLIEYHVNEDQYSKSVIDLHDLFMDDLTPLDELIYSVDKIGLNFSVFDFELVGNRYVNIDLTSNPDYENWTGEIELSISATDISGGYANIFSIKIIVDPVNDAPAISPSSEFPNGITSQHSNWKYTPILIDAENDEVTFSISGPENMSIENGQNITWSPSPWQVGSHDWSLVVADGYNERIYNFSIEVMNENDPPIIVSIYPAIINLTFGTKLELYIKAIDYDLGDIISYSLVEGPLGTYLDSRSGYLTWTPYIFSAELFEFHIRVADIYQEYADLIFNVQLKLEDLPPEISSEPDTDLFDLELWVYQMIIIDPDDDYISIELMNPPQGMELNEVSHTLTWTPYIDQLGSIPISDKVSSSFFVVYQNFTLNVVRSTRNWSISFISPLPGSNVDGTVMLKGEAFVDPGEVKSVFIKIGDSEEWETVKLTGTTWEYSLDTSLYSYGSLLIEIKAYDGHDYSDIHQVTLKISAEETYSFPTGLVLSIVFSILFLAGIITGLFFIVKNVKEKQQREDEQKQREDELLKAKKDMDTFLDEVS